MKRLIPHHIVTLIDLLEWRAAKTPDKKGYTFLAKGEQEEETLTYKQLQHRAKAIAVYLQQYKIRSERALMLYPQGLEFVKAFFGSLYAGAIAVPAYPPDPVRLNRTLPRLLSIIDDAQPLVVLTTSQIAKMAEKLFEKTPSLRNLHWVATDTIPNELALEWQAPNINGEDLAFLQYTSGSTASPKGVMISHKNMIIDVQDYSSTWLMTEESTSVTWLPTFHDLGLMDGVIEPVLVGLHSVLLSPIDFLQRPMRWLEAISRYKATFSSAPNFAFDLCIRKSTATERESLDLSSWKSVLNAAEPNRKETMVEFYETFKDCGFKWLTFCPGYGLAEVVLKTSGTMPYDLAQFAYVDADALAQDKIVEVVEGQKNSRTLVGCGKVSKDYGKKVIVVNPHTFNRCAKNEIGEFWILGPAVPKGYWNRPEATKESYQAYTSGGEGPFLRTGDLGFIKDDELFITGRLKDLIIIDGRNIYPQDIELSVEKACPLIRPGCLAAFSIDVNEKEALVVVAEINIKNSKKPSDLSGSTGSSSLSDLSAPIINFTEIIASISQAINQEHDLGLHSIVFIQFGSISKTSSGKIQRQASKQNFLKKKLELVEGYDWPIEGAFVKSKLVEKSVEKSVKPTVEFNAIKQWLINQLSERLGIESEQIDIKQPFNYYGLKSVEAINLSGELARWLNQTISPTIIYEYPNIESLAFHLAGEQPTINTEPSIAIQSREPIAIIGMSCRFPEAKTLKQFLELLKNGIDAISEIPSERWEVSEFYQADSSVPGKINTRWGGFIKDIDKFDPAFFSISPREAAAMDPQQRILLEIAWEALEDAGQVTEQLSGSKTGVFVGISTSDYGRLQLEHFYSNQHAPTGSAFSGVANRLSYLFNFQGPSLVIDTACSSSLIAVHLACQSIWRGEARMALAGGTNLVLDPKLTASLTQSGFLSPDGRCKTFDSSANGYARGEGAGVVVLKPLSRAIADGDSIYSVIIGSATNHNGSSNGLTAPSQQAQEHLLREAYSSAGVSPGQVEYIEAHGTGTSLGDPIEAKALASVVAIDRPNGNKCLIGSVKTNIGHLEAAAGIAGLIKVALSLKHSQIFPSLHFENPNPYIDFENLPIKVQTKLTDWPQTEHPHLAGVSSFGFGGSNAHVILQQAPNKIDKQFPRSKEYHLLTLSGRTEKALAAVVDKYEKYLAETENRAEEICYSAAVRRSHHNERLAVVGKNKAELLQQLKEWEKKQELKQDRSKKSRKIKNNNIVFVFSGQGPQWWAMAQELMEKEEIFRKVIEECSKELRKYTDWDLEKELKATAQESRLGETQIAQPAIFALQVGLARLLESWGVKATSVVGHSVGEVAAAHIAGVLTLEDAIKVVYQRGHLMQRTTGLGKTAALGVSLAQAEQMLLGHQESLSIAANNSPSSVTISGETELLLQLSRQWQAQGIYCKLLKVDYAFHSPQMTPLQAELISLLFDIKPQPATKEICSTVTAEFQAKYDAQYWATNIRATVLFAQAIEQLIEKDNHTFIEISPHPVLALYLNEIAQSLDADVEVLSSLSRDTTASKRLSSLLAELYSLSYPLDFSRLFPTNSLVSLPSYPWQHQTCWLRYTTKEMSYQLSRTGRKLNSHPYLDHYIRLAQQPNQHIWETLFANEATNYSLEYSLYENSYLPIGLVIEMVLGATKEVWRKENSYCLENIELKALIPISTEKPVKVQLMFSEETKNIINFQCFTLLETSPSSFKTELNLKGSLVKNTRSTKSVSLRQLINQCPNVADITEFYHSLKYEGLSYDNHLQVLKEINYGEKQALGKIHLAKDSMPEIYPYFLPPILLEACLQMANAALLSEEKFTVLLPVKISQLKIHQQISNYREVYSYVVVKKQDNIYQASCSVISLDGVLLAELIDIQLKPIRDLEVSLARWLYKISWQIQNNQDLLDIKTNSPSTYLVFADDKGVADKVIALLQANGDKVVKVSASERFANSAYRQYEVNPLRIEDFQLLFQQAFDQYEETCQKILHFWALNSPSNDELTVDSLALSQQVTCGSVLTLIQALSKLTWRDIPNLCLFTSGVQAVENTAPCLAQATLWGLARVIFHEHAELFCKAIDLSHTPSNNELSLLVNYLLYDTLQNQIVLRNNNYYFAKLVQSKLKLAASVNLLFSPEKTYLISGGTGALGLTITKWMVSEGAKHIVLLSRRGLTDSLQKSLSDISATGANIVVAKVDVSNQQQLTSLLNQIESALPPLAGIIHAATVLHDASLLKLDYQSFEKVLAAKAYGAWLLHSLTKNLKLDFFVCFSSAVSLLGSPGQANYSAANAFLDTLARLRHSANQPALSINWGPWADIGIAAAAANRGERLAHRGIASISPQQALLALECLFPLNIAQVAVMSLNLQQWQQFYPRMANSAFLSALSLLRSTASNDTNLRKLLLETDSAKQQRLLLESFVKNQLAEVLGANTNDIDSSTPLQTLGIDSIMALELRNRLEDGLGISLSATLIWAYPTVSALVLHLAQKLDISLDLDDKASLPVTYDTFSQEDSLRAIEILLEVQQLQNVLKSKSDSIPEAE